MFDAISTSLRDIAKTLEAISDDLQNRKAGRSAVDIAAEEVRNRRLFKDLFGSALFADPARDILLDLFVAEERNKLTSVSSASAASDIAPTTGLRYVAVLEKMGYLARAADPTDGRRVLLKLTEAGRAKMLAYLYGQPLRVASLEDPQSDAPAAQRRWN